MQKILIIGYVGRDPDLKYGPQGSVVAQFFHRRYRSLERQKWRTPGTHRVVCH